MLASCLPQEVEVPPNTDPLPKGVVSRVFDGDTIEVRTADGELTVRLLAVNAPETGECYADLSLAHLVETLEGNPVSLESDGLDQFGRTLAHVFVGDLNVNLEIVAKGFAMASTPDEGDLHGDEILAAEQNAYEERLGLWGPTACGTPGPLPDVMIDVDSSSPNPAGPDDENLASEMITLVNMGTTGVDLSGWILRDESSRNRYTFPSGVVIEPGERVSITSADPSWSRGDGAVWNNDGDMAIVQDPLGTTVDRWRY